MSIAAPDPGPILAIVAISDKKARNVGYTLIDFGIEITILWCIRSDDPASPDLVAFAFVRQGHWLSK
jgi:hypothetical protein